ncbi:hypothetical protein [Actinocorallia longicatena]|uniref:Uncharacterized protein n=1 Tax=Actinocorallia longicatena TaxID=111803 RepID=A0ABP6QGK7_9ACTN
MPRSHDSTLVPYLVRVYKVLLKGMPGEWVVIKSGASGFATEIYMLSSLGLISFVYAATFWGDVWGVSVLLVLLCVVRWAEIIGIVFEIMGGRVTVADRITALWSLAIQTTTIIFIFGSFFRAVTTLTADEEFGSEAGHRWWNYLFLSWKSLASFGSGVDATSFWAQLAVMASGFSGIGLLAITLSWAVSALS